MTAVAHTTETKVEFVFDALESAQVSITDFARLTKISRTTLHAWKKGGNVADLLRLNVAFNWAIRLDKAVDAKRLPFAESPTNVAERLAAIRAIVAEANREMRG